jgi:tetratricopeptide (TPR) repeat protein
MQGRAESMVSLNPGKISRLYLRQIWPNDRPIRWSATGLFSSPKITRGQSETELLLDLKDVTPPAEPPAGAPARFKSPGRLSVTEFKDWGEIGAVMAPMYDQALKLDPDSPLRAEVAKIAASTSDPRRRTDAALRMVQDQVRYLYLGMDLGGYTPTSADTTWSRRFGDCKGKSVLLAALLRELGIDAEVVFVSTVIGDGMNQQLPLVEAFNHAIVRVRIDGKIYWLDGTRQGDRTIERLLPPEYRWALPVRAGAALEPIIMYPPELPMLDLAYDLDASAGLDAPALVRGDVTLRGTLSAAMAIGLKAVSEDEREETLKSFWTEISGNVVPVTVDWSVDEATGDVRLTMQGAASVQWSEALGARPRRLQLEAMTIGWRPDFKREPGPNDDAPFATEAPHFIVTRYSIKLPGGGAGFRFTGSDVNQRVSAYELRRAMTLTDGVFTGVTSKRVVDTEIPFADAPAAEAGLSALSGTIYLEAPRGYKRSNPEREIEAARKGTTFFEYASRADAQFELGRVDQAIATIDAGVAREKDQADAYNVRCWLLGRANRDLAKAMADCEKALSLRPETASYLDSRALVWFRMGKLDRAIADYDAALERSPEMAASLFMRGLTKRLLGRTEEGDDDIATAIAISPDVAETFARYGLTP